MESGTIIPQTIEEEMRSSYMDYAMSVIISRALPDVKDGLKPVHRRILYAMLGEGLMPGKKYSKCVGVVGEVLKRLHPHGDSAVYNALVRMAQPWNLRYPLVDGQGNFGSVDGDSPAAYRYTECRMAKIAENILADLEKDTVDFVANFDDTNVEPVVLPSRIPVLLINGGEGIAVGMASSIPPHNLGEVINACLELLKNPEASLESLMQHIRGPDFPTGAKIYGASPIEQMYRTGKAIIKIRAKTHFETIKTEKRESEAIIVDEIPYQVNKSRLVERIAQLVNDKKVDGISRLRDESDRNGMRIVIELKRDAVAEIVLNQLYSSSYLQQSYGVTMRAIVAGRPKILSLHELLENFLHHRREVVTRRTQFELNKAQARAHILEGLKVALDHIDEVIQIIRNSDTTETAKLSLCERFSFSKIQATHILDMPLKRLTGLERKTIDEEYEILLALIANLKKILSDQAEINNVIAKELREILEQFSDERRTQIEEHGDDILMEDLIAEEDMLVTVSHKGYVKRISPSTYRTQGRGGRGVQGSKKSDKDEDFIESILVASTHAYLLVFTNSGKVYWIKVYEIPEASRTSRGRAIVNMLNLEAEEKVTTILPIRHFVEGQTVVMVSRKGYIKRLDVMDLSNVRRGGIRSVTLAEDDELICARLSDGYDECIISSKGGKAIRFAESDIRLMGRTARGVRAMKLLEGDEVVNMVLGTTLDDDERSLLDERVALLAVCENGYGKRTLLSEYNTQGRGGKGVIDIKTTERNGRVVGTARVREDQEVMIVTSSAKIIRIPVSSISAIGRNTSGVKLVNLDEGEKVTSITRVFEENSQEKSSEDDFE